MKSGVYIRVGRKTKDVLDLSDEEFVQLLLNELKSLKDNKTPSDELTIRVLSTYLTFVRANPEKTNYARIAALLTLEEMGRRFAKITEEWNECLKTLNFKNENSEH